MEDTSWLSGPIRTAMRVAAMQESCPNCGTRMVRDEYATLRCGKCGWIKDVREGQTK